MQTNEVGRCAGLLPGFVQANLVVLPVAAFLLHADGRSHDEVLTYLQEVGGYTRELAAKALGATTVDLGVDRSSVSKGESLVDTLRTLERTGVTTVVIRHSESGAPHLAARETGLRVINAGSFKPAS